ncbi:MAG: ABC transporter ATP-binding protein/permease [Eubacteriaceae bacterium]|nr:ABC transporter ATP-binding protein/permease [Eubacteriaceae bacterium]
MITLKNITKVYASPGGEDVHALKGISLTLRENEFVSILGPSGGGKTTLLNIIGGLDQYTDGDLIIDGVSTKEYKDKDWDTYRNHSVGFVFQNYNLISHQSVLANVELALTLSGVSRSDRRKRAIYALEAVGLGDQIRKKPNQLSGGQMQRVAIARALVNDPKILLADEPTGALDSKTSRQVMDILKKVAHDRLVVMVTHNPDLANEYSTRIINISDGEISGDSDPCAAEEKTPAEAKEDRKRRRPSMSFLTAMGLSANNLMTKRTRTLLTAFAGSIGIIGIALILSLSNGVNDYIARIQEETLSSYPLSIDSSATDLTSLVSSMADRAKNSTNAEEGKVSEVRMVTDMFSRIGTNDLESFRSYLKENAEAVDKYVTAIRYGYGITPRIYSPDTSGKVIRLNPSNMTGGYSSGYVSGSFFNEMLDNRELLLEQYDVIAGRWPEHYDEVILVLEDANQISDYMLYALGIKNPEEFRDMLSKVVKGEKVTVPEGAMEFTYDELLGLKYKLVMPADFYKYDSEYKVWLDMTDDEDYMKKLVDGGLTLNTVGIVTPKAGSLSSSITPGIAYTSDLIRYIIDYSSKTEITSSQRQTPDRDVFTGKTFDELNEEDTSGDLDFEDMIEIDKESLSKAFGMDIDTDKLKAIMASSIGEMTGKITADTSPAEEAFTDTFTSLFTGLIASKMQNGVATISVQEVQDIVQDYVESAAGQQEIAGLTDEYGLPATALNQIYEGLIASAAASVCMQQGGTATFTEGTAEAIAQAALTTPIMQGAAENMGRFLTETKVKMGVATDATKMGTDLIAEMAGSIHVDTDAFARAFKFKLNEEELNRLMSATMTSSDNEHSKEINLRKLGFADLNEPTSISFYFDNFEAKDAFKDMISRYNDEMTSSGHEEKALTYTDITGILMSSVTSIVNTVSYVLIAFVSVSLVVSSIMIGIITYISVLERTKEIGLLRAIGASKRDISRVFNAETFIIGLISGAMGIGITVTLCIPITRILRSITGIGSLRAFLQPAAGIALVIISVFLTFISGLIPSRIAAKKDPVIALRTE